MAFEEKSVAEYNSKNATTSLLSAKTFLASDATKQNEILSQTVSGKNENYCSISISTTSFAECDKIKQIVLSKVYNHPDIVEPLTPNFRLFSNGSFAISFFIGVRKVVTLQVTDKTESEPKTD